MNGGGGVGGGGGGSGGSSSTARASMDWYKVVRDLRFRIARIERNVDVPGDLVVVALLRELVGALEAGLGIERRET